MKYFFCTSNKINVNNKHKKYEISLTYGIRKHGDILLLFLSMRAAPSSDHFLNHALQTLQCRVVLITNASNFRKYLREKNIVEKSHSCLGIGAWRLAHQLLDFRYAQ